MKRLNKNCWLVKNLKYPPFKRCLFCDMSLIKCLFFQFLIVSLILVIFSLCLQYLIEKELSRVHVFSIFLIIFVFGYFFNQSTKKVVEANFLQKEAKKSLEKTNIVLEKRVQERTKELQELAKNLENQVKERTNSIRAQLKELERFQKLTVGRELKMTELKKEIKELKKYDNSKRNS